MSSGLAPQLPLLVSNTFGAYNLITNFQTLATQNLKMLVLTAPGERMMDINFGVGLRRYLFEPNDPSTYTQIDQKIREQVQNYLPYIKLTGVIIDTPPLGHSLSVSIAFRIIPLQLPAVLNLEVDADIN